MGVLGIKLLGISLHPQIIWVFKGLPPLLRDIYQRLRMLNLLRDTEVNWLLPCLVDLIWDALS